MISPSRRCLRRTGCRTGFPGTGGDLVLDHLDLGFGADHFVVLLDGADAPDVHAHRGVELEGVAAGGGFGLPNITPIFMRIWLMKMTRVLVRLMLAVSLRSAWDIRRACRPGSWSPISPSISAPG